MIFYTENLIRKFIDSRFKYDLNKIEGIIVFLVCCALYNDFTA